MLDTQNESIKADQWPPASQAMSLPDFKILLQQYPNGPGSMAWRINGEIIMVLGWGRAILMQVAHPAVGEGVAAHSHFSRSATDKLKRFQQTLNRMLEMTFGTPEQAWRAGHIIDNIHARVNGTLPAGHERYSARNPELLKWVSATFTDSMLKTYELFIEPLSPDQRDEYVRQASVAAPLLGAPVGSFPASYQELQTYLQSVIKSDTLAVGPRTRLVADYVIEGLPKRWLVGVNYYNRLPVVGLLPPEIRQLYGYDWSGRDATLLNSSAAAYRRLHPFLPARLRRWPIAIGAEKRT